MKNRMIFALAVALTLLNGCRQRTEENQLAGTDTVTTPYPGIQYIKRKSKNPNNIHVVKIDLTNPNNHVIATRSADRKMTVSKFAQKYKCKVAVNADFFNYSGYPTIGLAMGGGEVWRDTADNTISGFMAFGIDNRAMFSRPAEVASAPEWAYSVVGGRPMIVDEGGALKTSDCGPHFCARHPRSAAGISKDGKKLILAVVDGRSKNSKGATTEEMGHLLRDMGAWQAINFDGGGSSALYIGAKGGIVNKPSDGRERVVANHIGICEGLPDDVERRNAFAKAVKRSEVARRMVVQRRGKSFKPTAATGMFGDVPVSHPDAAFIEHIAREGITTGCGNGNFCPDDRVTRGQMAVFLLRSKHGKDFIPPAATGTVFKDVPKDLLYADWIEALAKAGITSGCKPKEFCPRSHVMPDQLEILLTRTFKK